LSDTMPQCVCPSSIMNSLTVALILPPSDLGPILCLDDCLTQ
jgi:hypothetical protein